MVIEPRLERLDDGEILLKFRPYSVSLEGDEWVEVVLDQDHPWYVYYDELLTLLGPDDGEEDGKQLQFPR